MSIARPERERESQEVLRTTHVRARDAKWFSWIFVLILLAVPMIDASSALAGRSDKATASPEAGATPALRGWNVLDGEVLQAFERQIESASRVRRVLQQRGQAWLTQYLSFGTHDVVVGRDRWLYYRPGLEYVIGRDLRPAPRRELLKPAAATHRRRPADVIRQFDLECRTRGVHLVVVPIPDKASLQPAGLGHSQKPDRPDNASYAGFVRTLRDSGVDIFEPLVPCCEDRKFLRQDTHWTPEYMTATAQALAAHVSNHLPPVPLPQRYDVRPTRVAARGDLLELLRLPAGHRHFEDEVVTIEEVVDKRTSNPWEPDRSARVLLLGDSFSNVYTDGAGDQGLGWGAAAGLGPQLSRFLNEPIDVIAMNGSGASATRRNLARRPAPFDGKAVIVWEFAALDLAGDDWDVVPFARPLAWQETVATASADRLVVQARVVKTSRVPDPATAPYSDCLNFVLLQVERVESGIYQQDVVLAVFRTMQDRRLLPAASYRIGDRLRLTLVPLRDAGQDLMTIRQSDDTRDYEHLPYFVVLAEAM